MIRRSLAAVAVTCLVLAAAACGSDDPNPNSDVGQPASQDATATDSASDSASGSASETPAAEDEPAEPQYEQLSEKELRATLLTIDDLPPGYSADPPDDGESIAEYCGKKPASPPIIVGQDFTKGGGMTVEVANAGLGEFESEEAAAGYIEKLRDAVSSCKGETVQGNTVTYAVMSTVKMEHPTVGIRVDGDGYTVLINQAQVGPTIVSTGVGGAMTADADLAGKLLVQQVEAYKNAAGAS